MSYSLMKSAIFTIIIFFLLFSGSQGQSLDKVEVYGFAGLLTAPDTVIEEEPNGSVWMKFKTRPEDPHAWRHHDCFSASYIAKQALTKQGVSALIGELRLYAPVGHESGGLGHTVCHAEINGKLKNIDLTPFSTGIYSGMMPLIFYTPEQEESFITQYRSKLNFRGFPLKIEDQTLILGVIQIFPNTIHFFLRGHRFTPDSGKSDFRFLSGSLMGLKAKRKKLHKFQVLLTNNGPQWFASDSKFFSYTGGTDPALTKNRALLWHMITKFK